MLPAMGGLLTRHPHAGEGDNKFGEIHNFIKLIEASHSKIFALVWVVSAERKWLRITTTAITSTITNCQGAFWRFASVPQPIVLKFAAPGLDKSPHTYVKHSKS